MTASSSRPRDWRTLPPVAQTFFADDGIGQHYLLDAIVTMVDAKRAPQQLDEHHEAQGQVGFADRILITKSDVVPPHDVTQLRQRLVKMNPRSKIGEAQHGVAAICWTPAGSTSTRSWRSSRTS